MAPTANQRKAAEALKAEGALSACVVSTPLHSCVHANTDNPPPRLTATSFHRAGNALFAKGRFMPAAERYTEAITLVGKDPAFAGVRFGDAQMAEASTHTHTTISNQLRSLVNAPSIQN